MTTLLDDSTPPEESDLLDVLERYADLVDELRLVVEERRGARLAWEGMADRLVSVHFRGRMDGFQASLLKTGAELGSNRRGIMEVRRSGRRWLFEAWKVLLGKSIDQFRANA